SRTLYGADQLPIDVVISPEVEVANGIARRLRTPGAFDTMPLADGKVQLIGIHCDNKACVFIGRQLRDVPGILPDPHMIVVAVIRDGEAFVPKPDDRIQMGDDVYVVTEPSRVDRVMTAFGHEERVARRVVIIGGGNVGLNLANMLAREAPYVRVKIIENLRERAEFISRDLGEKAVVLHGDALDTDVLDEANIGSAETVVAVTNDDETNIFSSVLAKRMGCKRAITLVNKSSYEPIMPSLGIDAVVSPNAITISTILRHVRHRSVTALYTLREEFGEVIEAQAQEGSKLTSGPLGTIGLPDGFLIGAVVRGNEVEIPKGETHVRPGDSIIAMVTYKALRKAEAVLAGDKSDRS
ncbi:MAG: Trk system potassium transporter TrkA, partial [Salinarimonadaceae bacterium]